MSDQSANGRSKPATNGSSKPGPKTAAAKAAVRGNAVKHAITALEPVIPGMQDEEEWYEFLGGIDESLAPEGVLEDALVERIAVLAWRLRRVTRFEVRATMRHIESTLMGLAIAENYMAGTEGDDIIEPDPERVYDRQQDRLLPSGSDLDKIMRYETHLHRQWLQTLHELEAIQARRGEVTHLAGLDISSSPLT